MSPKRAAAWASEVESTLRDAVGDETVEDLVTAWERHAARPCPEITVFGPFDVGKSSLIKRLLVEADVAVPEWLTVSARRETFELNEVDALGVTFTDTPGVAGGNDLHQGLAEDALSLSDAFMIVLPPNLITSNRELILDLAAGTFFRPDGIAFPEGALRFVISRIDEAGIDPADNPDGFGDLMAKKVAELNHQLAADPRLAGRPYLVSTLAADPYELTARMRQPARADYELGREWDGVASLIEELESMPSELPILRAAAQVRFFSRVGWQLHDQTVLELEREQAALGELRRRGEMARLFSERAVVTGRAAREDLESRLSTALSQVGERAGSAEEITSAIHDSAVAEVIRWQQHWDREVQRLAEEAQVEVGTRSASPAAEVVREVVDQLANASDTEEPRGEQPTDKVFEVLGSSEDHLKKLSRLAWEQRAGMSVKAAQTELKKVEKLDTEALDEYLKRRGGFANKKQLKQVEQQLETGRLLGEALPAITGLASEIWGVLEEEHARQEEVKRREEMRNTVDQAVERATVAVFDGRKGKPGWGANLEELREVIISTLDPGTTLRNALEDRVGELSQATEALETLLQRPPSYW